MRFVLVLSLAAVGAAICDLARLAAGRTFPVSADTLASYD
jgi:hypothetical protein